MAKKEVPKKKANIIMNALQGGVVPRTGLAYIAVGREGEISALLNDLEIIEDGGATFRFVTGDYGSGKTFLLQTIKENAVNSGYVVADADLSPEKALIGSSTYKKGLATFRELMGNVSIKTLPEGGALPQILNKWMDSMWVEEAAKLKGSGADLADNVEQRIYSIINSMQELVSGFDFAKVLVLYWKARRAEDKDIEGKALRWLRGEYRLKRDAQIELGVSSIINDEDWFNYIKLYASFFAKIGYKGMIIMIDEMINIYKYSNSVARQNNYERMLNMYNDALQGRAHHLGIIMGGTPKSVEDPNRGVFSYEALKSRLAPGRFKDLNVVNLMTPIIKIQPLTASEMVVLLEKLTEIHEGLFAYKSRVKQKDIIGIVQKVFTNTDDSFITPRSIIRDYIDILNILYQNPDKTIRKLLSEYEYSSDKEVEPEQIEE